MKTKKNETLFEKVISLRIQSMNIKNYKNYTTIKGKTIGIKFNHTGNDLIIHVYDQHIYIKFNQNEILCFVNSSEISKSLK